MFAVGGGGGDRFLHNKNLSWAETPKGDRILRMPSLSLTFVQIPCPLSKAATHEYMMSLPRLN